MLDIAAISTVLTSIKTATDIVKFIRESDKSLEKAESKLKLAELVNTLAAAKMQVVDIQEEITKKNDRIRELEEALETKDNVLRHYDGYYRAGNDNKPIGRPYCLSCWDQRHKLRELVQDHGDRFTNKCGSCGHKYPIRLTPNISVTVPEADV